MGSFRNFCDPLESARRAASKLYYAVAGGEVPAMTDLEACTQKNSSTTQAVEEFTFTTARVEHGGVRAVVQPQLSMPLIVPHRGSITKTIDHRMTHICVCERGERCIRNQLSERDSSGVIRRTATRRFANEGASV